MATRAAALESGNDAARNNSSSAGMGSPVEILSDTMGVDFGPYLHQVVHAVKQNWYKIIPPSASAPLLKKGKVSIEFSILKNGQVAGMHYVTSSGDVDLDRAAYGGIAFSNPFLPLPAEFRGQYLGLRFTFYYNPSYNTSYNPSYNTSLTAIAPSNAQLRAGSSLQFSPVLKRGTQPADSIVIWRVSGRTCTGSECGTISDGLYTAPLTVPNDPKITVEATTADLGERVSAVVTILPPDPSQNTVRH